ncbi:Hypothetical predicted protein [Mytilus galloprovincialis]|uniref:C-type lectin domain-containing protein n=1 Tax=Mytilus galloprovincialis TaxID=29158 RepID=A0A8B6CAI5_MYTGA|nr:Hypothetical predicted protein [Mytilus galloprovincialis]
MLLALIRLGLFGSIIVSGTFTCSRSDWVSDGSKCYKAISGSPSVGQNLCRKEDIKASLFLAPSSEEANNLGTLFSGEKIWVGLRFRNGSEWFWDNGSNEPVLWGSTPILPQLCVGVVNYGLMYDYYCYKLRGLICQKYFNVLPLGICEPGWTKIGSRCFKRLRQDSNGVDFSDARILCSTEGAHIMMPQSQNDASIISTNLDCV